MFQPVPFAVSADLVSVNLVQESTKGGHFSVSCNSGKSKIIYSATKGLRKKLTPKECSSLKDILHSQSITVTLTQVCLFPSLVVFQLLVEQDPISKAVCHCKVCCLFLILGHNFCSSSLLNWSQTS